VPGNLRHRRAGEEVIAHVEPVKEERTAFQQWYLVAVLTLAYTVSQIDRGAIYLVVEPIKHDLNVTDVQMSLLLGVAFVALYSLAIVPAGYIVDRMSRRLLLSGAVTFWSGAAMLAGFAGNYWHLFAARAGLGLGEAALPPGAYSLLRDGVAEKNRGRAFSLYQSGIVLGHGFGSLVGGTVFGLATVGFFAAMPFIGHMKPWQLVLFVPGLCGLSIALLLLTLREPPRTRIPSVGDPVSFVELFSYIRRNSRVYLVIFAGVITISLAMAGWNSWIVAALGRSWGLSPATIGTTIGTLNLIIFPISAFCMGTLMDFIKRRWKRPSAPFFVAIGGCVLNLGPAFFVLHAPSVAAMWVAYGFFVFLTTTSVQAACGYMLATVTPGRLMGKATSCYYLTNNLLAGATAPTIVATISQFGFEGPRGLANALTISYMTFVCVAVLVLLFGIRRIEDWHRANTGAAAA
jgi:MFS family permease